VANADPGIERAQPVSGRTSRRIARFAAFGAAHGLPLTHIVKSVAFLIVGYIAIGLTGDAYAQADRTSFSAARPYSATDRLHGDMFPLPGNIFVNAEYRVVLETMLARSSTFRRQCQRIANERSLAVHVRNLPVRLTGGVRATTEISRPSGSAIVARVTLHPFDNNIEMIAHEFEHIIEQLDDVDLAAKARRARSGVHAIEGAGVKFETTRALQVGLRVVREFRQTAGEGS
jgi:hypothetical protein